MIYIIPNPSSNLTPQNSCHSDYSATFSSSQHTLHYSWTPLFKTNTRSTFIASSIRQCCSFSLQYKNNQKQHHPFSSYSHFLSQMKYFHLLYSDSGLTLDTDILLVFSLVAVLRLIQAFVCLFL